MSKIDDLKRDEEQAVIVADQQGLITYVKCAL